VEHQKLYGLCEELQQILADEGAAQEQRARGVVH
jgi:hypothetical protein